LFEQFQNFDAWLVSGPLQKNVVRVYFSVFWLAHPEPNAFAEAFEENEPDFAVLARLDCTYHNAHSRRVKTRSTMELCSASGLSFTC
jgi:hypothetical protein